MRRSTDHSTSANVLPITLDPLGAIVPAEVPPDIAASAGARAADPVVTAAQVDTADHVADASRTIDDMFHNSPLQTKTESERAFKLGFVA